MSTDFAIIIPARFQSVRFPGKPLAQLRGVNGAARSLIRRSWDAARTVASSRSIWVATDDERIADAVRAFGGQVVITPSNCRNGTERCAAALAELGEIAPVIVNLQGDAPLTPAFVVEQLVAALANDPAAAMATPAMRCSPSVHQHLLSDQAAGRVGGTTVVFSRDYRALYFSKRVIPHVPEGQSDAHLAVHLHLGVYAYRPASLTAYATAAPNQLETLEGLEQLRFLDIGETIRIVPFDSPGWDCVELNNPEDVPVIEAILRERGIG